MSKKPIHPVHEVYDGIFNTHSGKLVNIINPFPSMICLEDIAMGLSNTCRFGGQIHTFYSVAQHSLLVWHLAPHDLKPLALLHDASEAYLGDVIKPLKVLIESAYGPIEECFCDVILGKYSVFKNISDIKIYDNLALEIEHSHFRNGDKRLVTMLSDINDKNPALTVYDQYYNLLCRYFKQYEQD